MVQPFRFRALVALRAGVPGQAARHYASPTRALMLRAGRLRHPGQRRFFSAEIAWDDQQPLKAGDRAVVTIALTDEDAEMYFAVGQRFTLWNGGDIGNGTISRQLFTLPKGPGQVRLSAGLAWSRALERRIVSKGRWRPPRWRS